MNRKLTLIPATLAAATLGLAFAGPASAVTPDPNGTYSQQVAFIATYVYDNYSAPECTHEVAQGEDIDALCIWHAGRHGQTAAHRNVHMYGYTEYLNGTEIPPVE